MPVTPFHVGLGLLGKGLFPRYVSVTAFAATQVVIDVEVAYFLFVRHEYPWFRWAHTLLGATALGLVVGLALVPTARILLKMAGPRWQVPDLREANWVSAVLGGLLGGVSHPILDGVMHDGVTPLRPFSDANPFLQAVSMTVLHGGLVAMGIVGLALLRRAGQREGWLGAKGP